MTVQFFISQKNDCIFTSLSLLPVCLLLITFLLFLSNSDDVISMECLILFKNFLNSMMDFSKLNLSLESERLTSPDLFKTWSFMTDHSNYFLEDLRSGKNCRIVPMIFSVVNLPFENLFKTRVSTFSKK